MTTTYCIDAKAKLILTRGADVIRDSDLRYYAGTVLSDPEVRPGFNELIDLSAVTGVQVSDFEIDIALQAVLGVERQVEETNTAIVASDRNAEATSGLLDVRRTRIPDTVEFFEDLSAARAWLGLSQEQGRWRAIRKAGSYSVRIRTGIYELSAQLINISQSGALLECATYQLSRGRTVKIQIQRQGGANVDLTGKVVRTTQNTFAIQFMFVPDELVDLMRRLGVRVDRTPAGLP